MIQNSKPSTATSASAPRWSSPLSFMMAAMGIAVGLGNLWRFPFQTGQNGGAAFVLVYVLCVAFIAWPILSAEIAFGRAKRLSAAGATAGLARDAGRSRNWGMIGIIGAVAGFVVLTTYSAVAGQIIAFALMTLVGTFSGDADSTNLFLYDGPLLKILWFSFFLGLTVAIVARGLKAGIEKMVTILMPMFFILLFALSVYAIFRGAPGAAISYLFKPDFSALSPQMVLAAMGQAFFSIAVGSAGMITYGAFLDRGENIASSAGIIAGADTLVALIAGMMIFPIVFAFALDPAAGMGLIFTVLPNIFSEMPGGNFIGAAFFFLAFIAALTTSISMLLTPTVIMAEWLGWSLRRCAIALGVLAWFIGVAAIFIHGMAESIDYLAGSVLLPLGSLLGAIFAGWILPRETMRAELYNASAPVFALWRFLIRWLCPLVVTAILIAGIAAEFAG